MMRIYTRGMLRQCVRPPLPGTFRW
jgi:hypothetical protein